MNPPCRLASLLLFLALAGAAAAQRPAAPELSSAAPAPAAALPPPTVGDATKVPAAAAAKSAAAPPLSPRFLQVRAKIDALFRHRNEAPPVIDPKANPFRGSIGVVAPGSAGATAGGGVAPVPSAPVNPELQLLQLAAAALKVAGVIQINGRDHLIINQAPYKEGDVIIARAKNQPVYLRLKAISRFTFTLTYNDAELAVKY